MYDFYYSFSIDIEKKSLKIGVDDRYYLYLIFPEFYNFSPKITSEDDGYVLFLPNIIRGIDIKYNLLSSQIKEYIIVKSYASSQVLDMYFNLDGCLLLKDNKKFVVLGKNKSELFNFEPPVIIPEAHNIKNISNSFCKMSLDEEKKKISYSFNKKIFPDSIYPVTIDPTFNFNTKIQLSSTALRTDFNSSNYMFVTGEDVASGCAELLQGATQLRRRPAGHRDGFAGPARLCDWR